MSWLNWLTRRTATGIPEPIWQSTLERLPFMAELPAEEVQRLRQLTESFLAEKEFSAAGGLTLTDEICVQIAIQGCLPILNLGLSAYSNWLGIIVYPDEFIVPRMIEDEDGIVHEFDDVLAGEAWSGGPLLISWHDAQSTDDGYNVVIHEFAHQLDMLNGEADGLPALHSGLSESEWQATFERAYDDFCSRLDSGQSTDIDPYAAEHPAEFFAVVSEVFFGNPRVVNNEYPAVYALLSQYYRQDPLSRLTNPAISAITRSA